MIVLNDIKIKSKSLFCCKNMIMEYKNILNYGYIECPFCQSHDYIKWGNYSRNVIYFNESNRLESYILKIQRIKCKSCNKTHALLPICIVPYKQYSIEVVSTILIKANTNSIESLEEIYKINSSIIKKWKTYFKAKHLSRIYTTFKTHDFISIMNKFINNDQIDKYIRVNNMTFMQIKLGIIGLKPS